jgi:hypothetical protein
MKIYTLPKKIVKEKKPPVTTYIVSLRPDLGPVRVVANHSQMLFLAGLLAETRKEARS